MPELVKSVQASFQNALRPSGSSTFVSRQYPWEKDYSCRLCFAQAKKSVNAHLHTSLAFSCGDRPLLFANYEYIMHAILSIGNIIREK